MIECDQSLVNSKQFSYIRDEKGGVITMPLAGNKERGYCETRALGRSGRRDSLAAKPSFPWLARKHSTAGGRICWMSSAARRHLEDCEEIA